MKFFSFELTMPSRGSWNGKWSGEDKRYFVIRKYRDKDPKAIRLTELLGGNLNRNFYYSWGDGWGANVRLVLTNASSARERQKISAGFAGYDWMIQSILDKGKIVMRVYVGDKEVYEDEIPKEATV